MSIEELGNPDREIKIQNIETVEKVKSADGPFDPEKDISEKDLLKLKEFFDWPAGPSDFLPALYHLNFLRPDVFKPVVLQDQSWDKIGETITALVETGDPVDEAEGVLLAAALKKFRANKYSGDLISDESVFNIFQHFQTAPPYDAETIISLKAIDPDYFSNSYDFNEDFLNAWCIETEFQQSRDNFLGAAQALSLLKLFFSDHPRTKEMEGVFNWSGLKDSLYDLMKKEKIYDYTILAYFAKIAASEKATFTEKGLEVLMPAQKEDQFKVEPKSMPLERNY